MSEESLTTKSRQLQRSQILDIFHAVFGSEAGEPVVFKPEDKELDRALADQKLDETITKIESSPDSKVLIGEAFANGQDEQRIRRDLSIGLASRKELLISALRILKMKRDALDKELS